jgi:D-alanyl-D-alanine carboxypeptidase
MYNDTAFTYSNGGYALSALMIERAAGQSWESLLADFMKRHNWAHFLGFPNRKDPNQPWGHANFSGKFEALPPDHFYKLEDLLNPAGNIAMNIQDYAQFIQLNLKGLTGNPSDLQAETYEKLHFGRKKYAFGWGNGKNAMGLKVSSHDGSAGTFLCRAVLYPEKKLAIVVMVNSADKDASAFVGDLRKLIFDWEK